MVAKQRMEDDFNRDMRVAWQTANLTRAEKLPALNRLLATSAPKKQSLQEQRSMLAMLSEQYGIKTRHVALKHVSGAV